MKVLFFLFRNYGNLSHICVNMEPIRFAFNLSWWIAISFCRFLNWVLNWLLFFSNSAVISVVVVHYFLAARNWRSNRNVDVYVDLSYRLNQERTGDSDIEESESFLTLILDSCSQLFIDYWIELTFEYSRFDCIRLYSARRTKC